jgi:hypothetical protein
LLQFCFYFFLFLTIFAIGILEGSCQFHLSNNISKVCYINVNLEPAINYPGLSLYNNLLDCIIAIDLRKS